MGLSFAEDKLGEKKHEQKKRKILKFLLVDKKLTKIKEKHHKMFTQSGPVTKCYQTVG